MRISDWSSDVCSSDLTFVSFDDGFNLKRLSTAPQCRHAFRAHRPVAAAHLGGPAAVARGAVGIAKRQGPGLVAHLARGEAGLGVLGSAGVLEDGVPRLVGGEVAGHGVAGCSWRVPDVSQQRYGILRLLPAARAGGTRVGEEWVR